MGISASIEIWGRRGHGKTKMAVALGLYYKYVLGLPVLSNQPETVENGLFEKATLDDLINRKNCVFILDEYWREMDSQDWKNPKLRKMTHLWQLMRHNNQVIIYTSQLRGQMSNRIRNTNDYSIYCEKKKIGKNNYRFKYVVMDGISFEVLKTWNTTTEKESFLYSLYDHLGTQELLLDRKE
jgi:hypothetical protein